MEFCPGSPAIIAPLSLTVGREGGRHKRCREKMANIDAT